MIKNKILKFAKKEFINVRLLDRLEWPIPDHLYQKKDLLNFLKKNKFISYEKKFDMLVSFTEIYAAN